MKKIFRSLISWFTSDPWVELRITVLLVLTVSTLTRLALAVLCWSQINAVWWILPASLVVGFLFDLFIAGCISLPFALFRMLCTKRILGWRPVQWVMIAGFFLFTYGIIYLGAVEFFFFEEFNSRFNYVAVDYLLFPHEIFVNIWDSYPVLQILIAVFVLALFTTYWFKKRIIESMTVARSARSRLSLLGIYAAVIAVGYLALNINVSRISDNRVLNEITSNGVYSFFYAAFTNDLDYEVYYSRIDDREAVERLRLRLESPDSKFSNPPDSLDITRVISDVGIPGKFNVILVLEESFGSNFVGSLHPDGPNCSPHFDSLAAGGLLFTQIYATGNRTVRGVEASLLSFPPIPGQSIVRRPLNENLFSLPSVFKANGYQTVFLYGGRAYFDNLRQFASHNNFDQIIDQSSFAKISFSTIWGVCDGDLFDNSLEVFDSLQATGGPFFATIITVSNHKPYLFPEGKIPFDPKKQDRLHAVRYADFAMGEFVKNARSHAFFDSTVFVFLGDHGARVYGSQQVPMDSYEIPILFYCPSLFPKGERINVLGSQMDLAPTLLDTLNFSYTSKFFGRSLFKEHDDNGFALLSHNRDVALFRDNRMAVLGILKDNSLWDRDPGDGKFTQAPVSTDSSLLLDAIAYYQTAYRLYASRRLGQ